MANGANPVSVLLQNHQLLVVVFALVVWFLKKLGLGGKKAATRPGSGGRVPSTRPETADEIAERTRRVQEDVRRKIAERRAAAAPPPPRLVVPRVVEETEPEDERIEFDRQQKLADQMRALEAARAAAAQQAAMISLATPAGVTLGVPLPPPPNPWLAELRDPNGVRRAILLREILGPPICLKGSV